MNDPDVFRLIGEGRTSGIFQLESAGMTQFMKELQPSSLEDIIAGISLYRPGPMDSIPKYIRNKNNPDQVTYEHPLLEKILDVTYGCIVYQEQVMQIVRELGGYSYGRSDLVRRAMSKKKHDIMQKERENFIYGITDDAGNVVVKGAVRNGVDEKTAARIFDQMMDFASYAFNKSHAAAYAVVAYQTAWLKHYYPVEFMAATLNSFVGNSDKVSYYVQECKQEGIEVLPPDVNESDVRFTVVNGKIRFGMAAVKNVGESAVRELIDERDKKGPFKSFYDFCERIGERDFNKRCVESLIKCGAFDSFGVYRSKMMAVYEKLLESAQQNKRSRVEGQLSLFEMAGQVQTMKTEESYPDLKEFSGDMLLSMEKEMLGLYISGHPLDEYKDELLNQVSVTSRDINSYGTEGEDENSGGAGLIDGMLVTVGGIVTEVKTKTTRSNNLMAFATLEDLYGSMEIIVFPTVLIRHKNLLTSENAVIIDGRISIKEEELPKVICENVRALRKKEIPDNERGPDNGRSFNGGRGIVSEGISDGNGSSPKAQRSDVFHVLYIKSDMSENSDMMKSVFSLLKYFGGKTPVVFCRTGGAGNITRSDMGEYYVEWCDTLRRELEERFGTDNVKLVAKTARKH